MTAATSASYIEGRKLTTWAVLPGGERVCLAFTADGGDTHRLALPFEALTGLLMTLPRMLQQALDERFPDGTLRVVHPLGDWHLEQAEGHPSFILKLSTRDGFEVAFSIDGDAVASLGTALLTEKNLTRRPN
jgi:hypothetical protein